MWVVVINILLQFAVNLKIALVIIISNSFMGVCQKMCIKILKKLAKFNKEIKDKELLLVIMIKVKIFKIKMKINLLI